MAKKIMRARPVAMSATMHMSLKSHLNCHDQLSLSKIALFISCLVILDSLRHLAVILDVLPEKHLLP